MMEYVIIVSKDNEANVWLAENSELPIVLEDSSLENLMERVKVAAPEIAEMNNLTPPTSLYFAIQAMVKEKLIANG